MDAAIVKIVCGYVVATFFITIGFNSMVNSVTRSKNFGIIARPSDQATLVYIKFMGAKELSLGLIIGMFMYKGDQKTAGLVSLIALVISTIDAWTVWNYNRQLREVWGNIIGVSFVGAVGGWLIG